MTARSVSRRSISAIPRSKNRGGRTYFDSAARIQSHTGNITVIPKLTGFAREGDSVTYTIDSAKAGTYAISFTGEFAGAAPLRVEVAGNVLHQQALSGNELTFGTANLPKGKFPLRLVAGKPKGQARAATVDDIFFTARSPVASKPLGLRPGPNATILLNGKPYRGIGVNYFSCFLRTLKDGNDTSYDAGFATLAEKGIPFARFCATGFWPRDMKLYIEDREEYFRRLDGVVSVCRETRHWPRALVVLVLRLRTRPGRRTHESMGESEQQDPGLDAQLCPRGGDSLPR